MKNSLLQKLKSIKFGQFFSQALDNLPDSIESLEFYESSLFNQPIDNLPSSLKKITLGSNFNSPLYNLPSGLEYLKISSNCYCLELKNLPNNLKYLYFYDSIDFIYEKELKNLPNGLIEIRYPYKYNFEITTLPPSVKIVRVSNTYQNTEELKKKFPLVKLHIY